MNAELDVEGVQPKPTVFAIRAITVANLFDSLKAGISDFAAAPIYGLFLGCFMRSPAQPWSCFPCILNNIW
jgi:uncharacterized membrane protein